MMLAWLMYFSMTGKHIMCSWTRLQPLALSAGAGSKVHHAFTLRARQAQQAQLDTYWSNQLFPTSLHQQMSRNPACERRKTHAQYLVQRLTTQMPHRLQLSGVPSVGIEHGNKRSDMMTAASRRQVCGKTLHSVAPQRLQRCRRGKSCLLM